MNQVDKSPGLNRYDPIFLIPITSNEAKPETLAFPTLHYWVSPGPLYVFESFRDASDGIGRIFWYCSEWTVALFFMSSGLIFLWAVNNAETQFSTPPNPRLMKIVITPEESKTDIGDQYTNKGIEKYK